MNAPLYLDQGVAYTHQVFGKGIQLVTAYHPYWRSMAMSIYTGFGSRHEPAAYNGIAHFTEHMLFKGTKRRSAKRISVDAEKVGGSINAYTAEDHTCYYVKTPAEQLARMADLMSDIYRHSQLPEAEISRERGVIEEEIQLYREQPGSHIEDLLSLAAWPRHPLGRHIAGTSRTLRRIDRAQVSAYIKKAHTAVNTVIAVAGPHPHGQVSKVVTPLFRGLPAGQRPREVTFHRNNSRAFSSRVLLEERPLEQSHFSLGFYTEGRHSEQVYASRLLSVLLGESMSSRLSQEIREKRGLCYQVCSQRELYREAGLLSIYAGTDGETVPQALKLIVRELRRLKAHPPSTRELRQTLDYIIGQQSMSLEDTMTQASWIAESVLNGDVCFDPDTYLTRLARVTPEEIQDAAKRIFTPKALSGAFLGSDLNCRRSLIESILGSL